MTQKRGLTTHSEYGILSPMKLEQVFQRLHKTSPEPVPATFTAKTDTMSLEDKKKVWRALMKLPKSPKKL